MKKRTIVETTYEYDDTGKLTQKTVTQTDELDDNYYGSTWDRCQRFEPSGGPHDRWWEGKPSSACTSGSCDPCGSYACQHDVNS